MKNLKLLLLSLTLITVAACRKNFDSQYGPDFRYLGPLMQTTLSLSDFVQAGDATISKKITAASLGIPTGNAVVVPAINGYSYTMPGSQQISGVDHIAFNLITLSITIDNQLPVNIGAGSSFTWKNSNDNSTVFTATLPQSINPFSQFAMDVPATNGLLQGTGYFELTGFNTTGSASSVVIDVNNFIQVKAKIKFDDVSEVVLDSLSDMTLGDTVKYKPAISAELLKNSTGTLTIFSANDFPATMHLQLYLLNKNKKIIDSVFDNATIISGNSGSLTYQHDQDAAIHVNLTQQKLTHLSRTVSILPKATFHFNPGAISITCNQKLSVQITADIKRIQ